MSGWKLSREMQINGVTPIDNIFISEFMLHAPGDYVKVYIYALMQCYIDLDCDIETIGHDLSMNKEAVESAFVYWERKGLIRSDGNGYIFMQPKNVVNCRGIAKGDALSIYKNFNGKLMELMPSRTVTTQDFEKAYDWMDIYGMSDECILVMVDYAVNRRYKKGAKISFSTLGKMAREWAEKGIKTKDDATDYVRAKEIIGSDAKKILNHLGQYRNPTVDEYNLLEKWEKEYGLDYDALIACCSQMVYSKSPSFALLDTIAEKYFEKGITTAEEIISAHENEDKMFSAYKEIVQRCGGFGSATKAQEKTIDGLFNKGFNLQGMLYICDYLVGIDKKGLSHTVKLAEELATAGITEENAVCEELDMRSELKGKVKEFVETLGFSRVPNQKDVALYEKYAKTLGHDVLLKGAEFASKAKNRAEHLSALLETWAERGVTTVDKATDFAPTMEKSDTGKDGYIRNKETYAMEDMFDVYKNKR